MGEDGSKYTIVYFLDYGKSFGGAVNTLIQQAVLMKQEGHQIVMFFSDYYGAELQSECEDVCLNAGLTYKWVTYQIATQIEDIDVICIDKNYEKVRDVISYYKPDILHSVQINPCVELISRELKIPHIMNIYPLRSDFFSIVYMNIFPHYHLCDSLYYARKWKYYLKTDSTCIRTVVNKAVQRRSINLKGPIRFICVGSIYEGKNQLTVIKAFHRASQQGIEGSLTLCGYADGGYGKECISYIENNNLQDKVTVKGFCSDMSKEYLRNDVLICGSTLESYPNAISEAMAFGLVIISTPVAGVPEVIEDGKNGYLTQDYTEGAICEKIVQAQRDIECGKVERILNKADEFFGKNHSPQVVKSQLFKYYQYVLNDYKQKKPVENNAAIIDIYKLRDVFRVIIKRFYQNEECFTERDKVAQKLWYLYHIQNRIKTALINEKKIYIWGAGIYGVVVKEIIEIFMPEIHISGFIDSKRRGDFEGYVIYQPDEILWKDNVVIFVAAANGQNEIKERLEERKMIYNVDYFILAARCW